MRIASIKNDTLRRVALVSVLPIGVALVLVSWLVYCVIAAGRGAWDFSLDSWDGIDELPRVVADVWMGR